MFIIPQRYENVANYKHIERFCNKLEKLPIAPCVDKSAHVLRLFQISERAPQGAMNSLHKKIVQGM